MKKPIKINTIHDKKRFGQHQKRTRNFHDTYLPYLPMTVILFISVFISGYSPRHGTLAYATNVSQQGLLDATNSERAEAGKSGLKLNAQLNSAAQAKANDMTSRNYWSHNTPDGKEPWVFVNSSGYSYLKAGENLAYGFATSSDTIQGWMNSPTHKDNMLDGEFVDVGFGFANNSDYNNAGEETVVVAMYGKPYVLASNTESTPSPVAQAKTEAPTPTDTTNTAPAEATPPQTQIAKNDESTALTKPSFVVATPQSVSRIESLTSQSSPWLVGGVGFMTGLLMAILLLRHSMRLRHLIKNSRSFITHHPLIDSTILALIILGITLTRTVGFIL